MTRISMSNSANTTEAVDVYMCEGRPPRKSNPHCRFRRPDYAVRLSSRHVAEAGHLGISCMLGVVVCRSLSSVLGGISLLPSLATYLDTISGSSHGMRNEGQGGKRTL
jgi:hypothetical protein